jgi:hypothetical protein
LPANAIGKSSNGSLILTKCIHMLLSSVQNQVINGMKKRKLIPSKKGFLKNEINC